VTGNNKISEEITNRLMATNRSYFGICCRNLDLWCQRTKIL